MQIINPKQRVQAITFATNQPEEMAAFYQQALNIPVARKLDKDHLGIQLEDMYIGFDRTKEKVTKGPGGPVIWFYVENVEAAFTHMVAMGARVRTNVTKDLRPGLALAVFFDPDDNLFGLMGPSVPGGGI